MYLLENPVRDYAWGSRTHLPRFLGREPDGRPWAELWMGAHPSAPSRLPDGTSLDVAIARDAESMLGHGTRATFGNRLPFLMKLLAAAEPLSLQVHPTTDRARIRCAEQDAAGLARDAPDRTYPDASHKPEMIYALTRFEGMAGFRDPAKTAPILRGLDLPWLDEVADRIEGSPTPFQTLRAVVTETLARSGTELDERLEELRLAAEKAELRAHSTHAGRRVGTLPDPTAVERESVRVYAAVARLVEQYPADPGVLVTLLLNHVVLAPGEAMFIDAGVIHAYTSGFGVEIMAASDNVLRAGLTVKHVDVPELIEVANFTPMPPPLWAGATAADVEGGTVFTPPVDEFELAVLPIQADGVTLREGPQLLLCLDGELQVSTTAGRAHLPAGTAVFVGGNEERVDVTGKGRLVVGRTP
ncbi:MAG TPA: mannose-6-phosphate isomerase, class I [Nocardioides sp.]|uniref:mannose-6-phosphate isomerase, class I n=1 Tax=Nocardioides sp. TaxID=35761 RepID=UPI002D7EFEA5|nr:mannose-6-phosphate isomerase, class I [Nocardioides sp.]HET6652627.1 mannose-6-phosphate isomerase, class I [Nocardioides sp.]